MAARLKIYVRSGCHLCTDMAQALDLLRPELDFDYTQQNIDADPDLVERYGSRIPVLAAGDVEICYYFLEEQALRDYLDGSV
ncbi:MAG: glutaredoxin family protein [Gammaproteobacteria bacterium]